ncbi:hypothetical protein FRC11_007965 [Ceratobasidium sp. 423]|nr:hypothetical protein FRC11_007965 [Ceratobasidium sp. 423]
MAPKRFRPSILDAGIEDLPSPKLAKHTPSGRDNVVLPQPAGSEKTSGRPRTPPSAHSSAIKDTPYRRSTSHPCSIPKHLSQSSQSRSVAETLPAVAAQESEKRHTSLNGPHRTKEEMEVVLRMEINGAIYEYPELCNEFFHADEPHLDGVLGGIVENDILRRHNNQWFIQPGNFSTETHEMHQWCAKLLDMIMHAAFRPTSFRPSAHEIMPNWESRLVGDHQDDSVISPDIVQGILSEKGVRHWGDLEFFAECKATSSRHHIKEALMQIARYSRALFTHQIYRRHIYSLAICGTKAIFVRISRGFIAHSPAIDFTTDAEQFIRAVAGLFTLDDHSFGYNTLFYYWPPLRDEADETDRQLRIKTGNWRWVVVEILCHRMCLIGRATIVLLLRRVGHPQHYAVIKLIWRPETRIDESKNLAEFSDCHGVCQCRWNLCDDNTKVLHPNLLGPSPFRGYFVPTKGGGQGASASGSRQTSKTTVDLEDQTYRSRDVRHYSMVLMDEGVSLWRIKHLVHLLRVLRDGIVDENETAPLGDLPDRYNFENIAFLIPEEVVAEVHSVDDYIAQRYATQPPLGRLFDFEFMVGEARKENQVRSCADRTGTVAFMSSRILLATKEAPVVHDFLDDLESFFWVFLWLIFTRGKVSAGLDDTAKDCFRQTFLNQDVSPSWKRHLITDRQTLLVTLRSLTVGTGWDKALAVAYKFCNFLRKHQYSQLTTGDDTMSLEDLLAKPAARNIDRQDKWRIIQELIGIFDSAILELQ